MHLNNLITFRIICYEPHEYEYEYDIKMPIFEKLGHKYGGYTYIH